MSAQKAPHETEKVTRELLGGMEEKSISLRKEAPPPGKSMIFFTNLAFLIFDCMQPSGFELSLVNTLKS